MGGSNCDRNFYPRSPCGERHTKHFPALHHILISIHALLAESDVSKRATPARHPYFYPRSPCGERQQSSSYNAYLEDFYPRSPCGERRKQAGPPLHRLQFLSTLSLRRATRMSTGEAPNVSISIHALLAESDGGFDALPKINTFISIHALLAESDPSSGTFRNAQKHFYPRSPCGERQWEILRRSCIPNFYPRSPCGERRVILII